MFWTLILIGFAAIAIGWIGYGIYYWKVIRPEDLKPKKSETYNKAQDDMKAYAERMRKFEEDAQKRREAMEAKKKPAD